MIVIGAKGFAKEVLEVLQQRNQIENLAFYDDVNEIGEKLYDTFPILKNEAQVKQFFKECGNQFTIGIGNPIFRYNLYKKFTDLGGECVSVISPLAQISSYEVNIGVGSTVLMNAVFSNSVTIGKGCLVYYNAIITHDCVVGDFVEISPGATLLGRCTVGSFTRIGANATILPDVNIGSNVTIGAGAVVTKDVPDNTIAFGVPAVVMKTVAPLNENIL
ncbi:acetyltransferase [Flavobacterium sp.]|jgi:sugar O-acyltransferase (sialic acid O-acetyltransferase NeuD family)|uniref:acetyltransferase n=1 Tax=Flavobacterium sp. TaxID=239 RepID=UPI0037845D0A